MGRFSASALTLFLAVVCCSSAFQAHGKPVGFVKIERRAAMYKAVKDTVKHKPVSEGLAGTAVVNGGGGGSSSITVEAGEKIQDAVDEAQAGATIYIKGGTYRERVVIPESLTGLKLIGDGNPTIICNDAAMDYGGDTRKASCVSIFCDKLTVKGITFENDFGWTNGRKGAQAPALLVMSDQAAFFDCSFVGFQDTLFTLKPEGTRGRQYFKNCYIEGAVDYVFGDSAALFEDCTFFSKNNDDNHKTSITAHYRQSLDDDTGYVILRGVVKGNLEYKKRSVVLGRTWGEYATCIYAFVKFEVPTEPEGWTLMKKSPKSYTKTAIFHEFKNEGTDTSQRNDWVHVDDLSKAEQGKYLGKQYIDGDSWIPAA